MNEPASRTSSETKERHSGLILFSLATQFENLGDCVINEIVIKKLSERSKVVVLTGGAPKWLLTRLAGIDSITLCSQWFAFAISPLQHPRSSGRRVLFFKPGHFAARSGPRALSRLAAVYVLCAFLRWRKWSIARIGVSVEAGSWLESQVQARLGRLFSFYGVRDLQSRQQAAQWGIRSAAYAPDLAFLLQGPSSCTQHQRRHLALSFRNRKWMKMNFGARLARAIGGVRSRGLEPLLVDQVLHDGLLAQEMQAKLRCDLVSFRQTTESAASVFAAYESSVLVVSNRLHSLLFGWSRGTIPLALVCPQEDKKIIELFKSLGLEMLLWPAEKLDRLEERIDTLCAQADALRNRLCSMFLEQQALLTHVFEQELWLTKNSVKCIK
jgi:polysaccharide pyruvyl transferase WcaK-like protein